jgi:hypothetical protein
MGLMVMDYPDEDLVITERAALVAWHLAHGEGMTTGDVARLVGVHESTARRMMYKLSRVLPIIHKNGCWEALFCSES